MRSAAGIQASACCLTAAVCVGCRSAWTIAAGSSSSTAFRTSASDQRRPSGSSRAAKPGWRLCDATFALCVAKCLKRAELSTAKNKAVFSIRVNKVIHDPRFRVYRFRGTAKTIGGVIHREVQQDHG
jgi:hypothetical protein